MIRINLFHEEVTDAIETRLENPVFDSKEKKIHKTSIISINNSLHMQHS